MDNQKKRSREEDDIEDYSFDSGMEVSSEMSRINNGLTMRDSQLKPTNSRATIVPANYNGGFIAENRNSTQYLSSLAESGSQSSSVMPSRHDSPIENVDNSAFGASTPNNDAVPPRFDDDDFEFAEPETGQATVSDQPPLGGSIPDDVKSAPTLKPRKLILRKYTIYRTDERMIIIGSNSRETMFRILEIDLTTPVEQLSIVEDNVYFNRKEMIQIFETLEESKTLTKIVSCYGLLGFVKFTHNYYLHTVTERSIVGILGGHNIYKIDSTQLVPVINEIGRAQFRKNASKAEMDNEQRLLSTFERFSLDQNFYFSYTYDITNTLQKNFLSEKFRAFEHKVKSKKNNSASMAENMSGLNESSKYLGNYNEMFVWNVALLKPAVMIFDRTFDWFQPIIHGFFNQANLSIYNRKIYITLIARRSHHFAGARFLKRGVNDKGYVANEVETEQIVSDGLTTSFHNNANGYYMNPGYTSFIQHRGSIPLFWTQDTNVKISKPPITMTLVDPFYSMSALHFDKLFKRYGSKIFILNLIKQKEKTARESLLGKEFKECVDVLNKFLPQKNKLDYVAWDMSRASKASKDGQVVLEYLERYSDKVIKEIGIFHNSQFQDSSNLQNGICRTNCIDCLDRTNMAQFIIGKKALGHQLKQLGVYDNVFIEYDSDAVNLLYGLFNNHGNIIALQYGGSNLVNTMETYRKINQWSSKKNDLIENMKRFYSNSFVDPLRQDSINLFLGNYDFEKLGKRFLLWDLSNDYFLHNSITVPLSTTQKKRSFCKWWNDDIFDTWDNLRFPPKNYLLNGDLDEFKDDPDYQNVLTKLLNALVIDRLGKPVPKRVFTGSFSEVVESSVSKADLKFYRAVLKRKCKEYVDTKLVPYPGKQMDSYWVEYYTPRRLTNFKLLFDMNMKSSITLDSKELSGAKFAEDTGDIVESKETLDVWEESPFKSRVPVFINSRLRKMYPVTVSDELRKATRRTNLETSEFMRWLWPKLAHKYDEKDEESPLLKAQLAEIVAVNKNLMKQISDDAFKTLGVTASREDDGLVEHDDASEQFSELYDEQSPDDESSRYNLISKSVNYNILNLFPNNINFIKLINKSRPEKEKSEDSVNDEKLNSSNERDSAPQNVNTFDYYLFDPISSIKNLKLYDDNVKFDEQKANLSLYDTSSVGNGTSDDSRLKSFGKLYGDETVIYHDVDDKLSIISDFYNEQSTVKNLNMNEKTNQSQSILPRSHSYGNSFSLPPFNSTFDDGYRGDEDILSIDESSFSPLEDNNFEGDAIVINPAMYEEKLQQYSHLVPADISYEVPQSDIDLFNYTVALSKPRNFTP